MLERDRDRRGSRRSSESGRPCFVMEHVKGIRITHYCDQNELATEERLMRAAENLLREPLRTRPAGYHWWDLEQANLALNEARSLPLNPPL